MSMFTRFTGWPRHALFAALLCLLVGATTMHAQSQLPLAKQIADLQVQAILNTPVNDPMLLKHRMATILQNHATPFLDDAESALFAQYIQSKANLVQDKITQFRSAYAALGDPQVIGAGGTCYTFSIGFIEFYCETGSFINFSVGVWDCSAMIGAHPCLSASGGSSGGGADCGNDGPCPPGYRCATWAFKPDECVKECDDNSDCPPGQSCKKPFGTSFKRCK